ncbi:hypothetical protein PV334_02805 [Streptomyces sp. ME02-7008A-1]|uniref:hypothetical protein n=1 Tax=Streptomyces TaxID=1883 RepID=UPI00106E5464|nr:MULTISPECIES: hypothetical protein [unclassified Streptomyces]MDX3180198.1 hypothetical protein [Streptomyces sp. ME02-7008A-1]MDX3300939.1 hypothetical protein [Streptomyces sp. ME02-7008A]QBR09537.1 hypothetical protein D7Y56_28610 [Streptomyces sp. S501]
MYDMTDPVAAHQAAVEAELKRLADQERRQQSRETGSEHRPNGFVLRKWRWLGVNGADAVIAVRDALAEMLQSPDVLEHLQDGYEQHIRQAIDGSPDADGLLPAVGAALRNCAPKDVLNHLRTLNAAEVEWFTAEGMARQDILCSTAPSVLLSQARRHPTGGPAYTLFTSVATGGAVPLPRNLLPDVLSWAPRSVVDDLVDRSAITAEDMPWKHRPDGERLYLRARLTPRKLTRDEAQALGWTAFVRRAAFVAGEELERDQAQPDVYDLLTEVADGDLSRLHELDAVLPTEQRTQLRNLRAGSYLGSWPPVFLADRGLWALMSALWDPQDVVNPRLSDFHAWVAIRRTYDLVLEGRLEEAGKQAEAFDRSAKGTDAPSSGVQEVLAEALNFAAYVALAADDLKNAEELLTRAESLDPLATHNLRLVRAWRETPKNDRGPLTNPYLDLSLPHGCADWEARYRDLVRDARDDVTEYARLNRIRGRIQEADLHAAEDDVFFWLPLDLTWYETPRDVPQSIVPPLVPLQRRTAPTGGAEIEAVRARAAVELLDDFRVTVPHLDRHRR